MIRPKFVQAFLNNFGGLWIVQLHLLPLVDHRFERRQRIAKGGGFLCRQFLLKGVGHLRHNPTMVSEVTIQKTKKLTSRIFLKTSSARHSSSPSLNLRSSSNWLLDRKLSTAYTILRAISAIEYCTYRAKEEATINHQQCRRPPRDYVSKELQVLELETLQHVRKKMAAQGR